MKFNFGYILAPLICWAILFFKFGDRDPISYVYGFVLSVITYFILSLIMNAFTAGEEDLK